MSNTFENAIRPDFVVDVVAKPNKDFVVKPLAIWERVLDSDGFRRAMILILLAAVWQAYALFADNDLVFPKLTDVLVALWRTTLSGVLPARTWNSLQTLLTGYALGIGLGVVITTAAITTRLGSDLLATLTAMFNPLPAIALLPLALLWFGLGSGSVLFVLAHSVLWPFALNTHAGYQAVSETLRLAGRNCGLPPLQYVMRVLMPAALPSIIAGLKISWAFGWRTLIAAELVFGASSSGGGVGWFIFEKRNDLKIPDVFAGLLVIVLIGLFMEGVFFRLLERHTVRKWGMVRSV
ncbi:ABC transporter permease subunit [Bradyrhizobium sp. LTSP857]|uniref:ABC transporter permease n=1 Tax=Bradyrhizobium sp. LTSP857 TaxID=1619231 RepID=UPI0005D177B7|nr:ABC transporter permease subunit [Bradyrhizobium sp. LTSP857]KJC50733.1 ABC transporter permease [Bradyrhizobium sp. LTSP857]